MIDEWYSYRKYRYFNRFHDLLHYSGLEIHLIIPQYGNDL